jgi:hypothetical protein
VLLVQQGRRICGRHSGASPGLGRLDDGDARSVTGTIVGRTANLVIRSGRSDRRFHARATLRGASLDWVLGEEIGHGDGDTEISGRDRLHRRPDPEDLESVRRECASFFQ